MSFENFSRRLNKMRLIYTWLLLAWRDALKYCLGFLLSELCNSLVDKRRKFKAEELTMTNSDQEALMSEDTYAKQNHSSRYFCSARVLSIDKSSLAEGLHNSSGLRRKLLDPEEAVTDEKVITDSRSKEGLVPTAIDGACGEDCGHEICAC